MDFGEKKRLIEAYDLKVTLSNFLFPPIFIGIYSTYNVVLVSGIQQSESAELFQDMWDLSSLPGMKPASPALEGRFLTTGPPGKSPRATFHALENTVFVRLPAVGSHMPKCHTLFLRLT